MIMEECVLHRKSKNQRGKNYDKQRKSITDARTVERKLETAAKAHVNSREDLAIAYTPGVAEPCKVIAKRSGSCLQIYNQIQHRSRSF